MGWRSWIPWLRDEPRRRRSPSLRYDGGSTGRRTDGWIAPASDANASIESGLAWLQRRSHDLVRNNALAVRAVNSMVTHLVGSGVMPHAATGDPALDIRVDALARQWAEDVDLVGVQRLAVRAMVESGDGLIRRRRRRMSDGLAVPIALQVLEGEMLDLSRTEQRAGGNAVIQGVESDGLDRRVGYWLYRQHPGSTLPFGAGQLTSARVDASEIAHVYEPGRPGQVRGAPWLAPALIRLRDWDEFVDSTLSKARAHAMIVGSVEDDNDYDVDPGINPRAARDANDNIVSQLEPGQLLIGHGVQVHHPPGSGMEAEWSYVQLHEIATALRMPYELLTGDLSRVNYSSIRFGILDFRRTISQIQQAILLPMMLRPIWRWFVDAAIASGRLPERDYPVTWSFPRWEDTDREKAAQADRLELRNGTTTLRRLISERGEDPEEVLRDRQRTDEMLDDLGIVLDSDPRWDHQRGRLLPGEEPETEAPSLRRLS